MTETDFDIDLDAEIPTAEAVEVPSNAATDKQVAFIKKLIEEKHVTGELTDPVAIEASERTLRNLASSGTLTKAQASHMIDLLVKLPRRKPTTEQVAAAKAAEAPEGMHKLGNEVFKVQRSQSSGRVYAKRLAETFSGVIDGERVSPAEFEFVYARGAASKLNRTTQMTLEQAKEFGCAFGTCAVCGRTLTNEVSIAAGIGPVCRSRF